MPDVRASIEVPLDPGTLFDLLVEELAYALARSGLRFEAGAAGRVLDGQHVAGRVTAWTPGEGFSLEWHGAPWNAEAASEVRFRVEPASGGARATLEHRGWGGAVGEPPEIAGWFAGEVLAPLLKASAPAALGDWITDRRARRPSGAASRATYGDPVFHYPNFRVILEELALGADDYLLEVACGGGALLKRALTSGCRAAAIDYSADMIRLAREQNREAIAAGRLDIREADAAALPFPDATFTCAAMTGVLGFLPDPVRVLGEIRRVLRPGGRFVGLGADPELKGTPGAPEPMASRLRFYESDALEALGRQAGFDTVKVIRRDLEPYAREAGVPAYALPLFAAGTGGGARFLVARRS